MTQKNNLKKVFRYIAILIALLSYAFIAFISQYVYTPIGYILWIALMIVLYVRICKNVPKVLYYLSILILLFFLWQEYYYGGIRGPLEWSIADKPIDYPSQWNNCYPLYRWSTYLFLCIINGGGMSIIIIACYRLILCMANIVRKRNCLWIYFTDRLNENRKTIKSEGCFIFLILSLLICGSVNLFYSSYDILKKIGNPRVRHAIPDNTIPPIKETIQDTLLFSNDTVYVSTLINLHGGDAQYKKQQLLQIEQLLSTEDKVISGCKNFQEVTHKLLENNWKDVVDDDNRAITCYRERYSISQINSLPGFSSYCLSKIYEWEDGQTGHVSVSEGRGTYVDSTTQKINLEDIVINEKIDDVLSIVRDHILIMCSEGRDSVASGWTEDNSLLYDNDYLSSIACITKKGILFTDTMWPTFVHLLLPYEEIKEYVNRGNR